MATVTGSPSDEMQPADRFDRLFDDWVRALPLRRPGLFGRDWATDHLIRVDQFREDGTLVVRAELAGVDPERDLDVSLTGGMLRIDALRHEPSGVEDDAYLRREIRSGSLSRTLPLPDGVAGASAEAHYEGGILTIRFPWSPPTASRRITVAHDRRPAGDRSGGA